MGLKERQQIDYVQREILPVQNQRLCDYTGASLSYEVDWATFADDLEACYSLGGLLNLMGNAWEWVARQPPGRQALAQGITGILIQNTPEPKSKQIALNDKVLTVITALSDGTYTGRFQEHELIEFLEQNL